MKSKIKLLTGSLRRKVIAIVSAAPAYVLFFGGLASITFGVWMFRPAAGFIVGGLFAVWIAFLVAPEQ